MNDLHLYSPKYLSFRFLKQDMASGLVVFLVALPLCLGISLASGAGLFAGLITGIIGGLVVSVFSGSQLSVSGPAAGLTVIVLSAITSLGSYEVFLLSVVLAGIMQIVLGITKAGVIVNFFPSSVIKGMLAAIGIILIMKQVPYAIGYGAAEESHLLPSSEGNLVFSGIASVVNRIGIGSVAICILSLGILLLWERPAFKKVRLLPGPLVVVVCGILAGQLFKVTGVLPALGENEMVKIPVIQSVHDAAGVFRFPDFNAIMSHQVWVTAITLAIVASLETLLSLDAIDKLDPLKRVANTNKELKAQGLGNIIAGFLGGLPMTAVIVRGSANVNAGGQTRTSSFFHGLFLLAAVLAIPYFINMIPLSALAAVLLVVGYKLTRISLYKEMARAGWDQLIPFLVTIIAIVTTDLLIGISVGMAVGLFFILRRNMRNAYRLVAAEGNGPMRMVLADEVTFLNKAAIHKALEQVPANTHVVIDGSASSFIDKDVLEIISYFKQKAEHKDITVDLVAVREVNAAAHH